MSVSRASDSIEDINVPDGLLSVDPALALVDPDLADIDGHAFATIGAVREALRTAGNPPEIIKSYTDQATAGDYDHLIQVSVAFTDLQSWPQRRQKPRWPSGWRRSESEEPTAP